jgi:hypothetical protein
MVLNAFPAVVLAWKSAGTRLPRCGDERAEAEWNEVGDLLYGWSGHGEHAGWHFCPQTQRLECACGAALLEASAAMKGSGVAG